MDYVSKMQPFQAIRVVSFTDVPNQSGAKNITETLCGNKSPRDESLVPIFSGFLALAGIAVFLRLVARYITLCYFWWDDLFIFLAFVSAAPPPLFPSSNPHKLYIRNKTKASMLISNPNSRAAPPSQRQISEPRPSGWEPTCGPSPLTT